MWGVVVLAAAEAFCDEMRCFDPALLSGDECASAVAILARVEKIAAAGRARAALRAAEWGAHGGIGLSDAPEWLARQTGMSRRQASDELAAVAMVETCAATRDALVAGEVSLTQARHIAMAEREVPGSQHDLLALARHETLAVLRDSARTLRHNAMDATDLYRRQHAAQAGRHWRDDLGMTNVSVALPPDVGVAFTNRWDTETDRIYRAAHRAGRHDPRDVYAAEAFIKMFNTTGGGGGGASRSTNAEVVFVVDLTTYRTGTPGLCKIVGGGPVPVDIVRTVAQDAFLKAVVHDSTDITHVKHFGRHVNAQLRTALNLGPPPSFDGLTCQRCGNRYRIQIDHQNPLANGGPTSKTNLRGLCPPCHTEKTEQDRRNGLLGPTPRFSGTRRKGRGKTSPGAKEGARGKDPP